VCSLGQVSESVLTTPSGGHSDILSSVKSSFKDGNICEKKNKMFNAFEKNNPRTTAYAVHESMHNTLQLQEDEVKTVQVNVLKVNIYKVLMTVIAMQNY
jgi:hypothetical protein